MVIRVRGYSKCNEAGVQAVLLINLIDLGKGAS